MLSTKVWEDLNDEHKDVQTKFPYVELEDEVYMHQPGCDVASVREKLVYNLYSLSCWSSLSNDCIGQCYFQRCYIDDCCHIKRFESSYMVFLLSVEVVQYENLRWRISMEFEMKDYCATKLVFRRWNV